MTANKKPALLPTTVDHIPAEMLDQKRWAPWRAEWNPKAHGGQGKYVKIPHRADRIESGLSNKSTAGWVPFHRAMAVYMAHPDKFAGVGYLMTGPHGVTGVDLDHCVEDGVIAPWAAEVVAKLDSYTEVSPSGTGLHVMLACDVPEDWMNHERGIEVYGGNAARFLCVTGAQVAGSPSNLRAPRAGVMDNLASRWRRVKSSADIVDLHLPTLVDAMLLPEVEDLDLPPHARNFLIEGPEAGRDRSGQLFAASIALNQLGLPRDMVLSILEANEYAMEVALDHRRQDYDKALRYLWKEHCSAGAARAEGLRQLDLDQFDVIEAESAVQVAARPAGQVAEIIDDFEDLTAGGQHQQAAPKERKRARFTPINPADFLKRKPGSWIIKGVVPKASLAVIFGASGSGKTFFTLDLCGAIARGADWRGQKTTKGRGVYIVAEGAGGFRNRLEAYCAHHGIDPASFDMGVIADAPNFLDKAHMKDLCTALVGFGKIDFVVVDTYARVMPGGNENDSKDTGQVVAHCDLIHRLTGALVILVHHSGKDATKGARGSNALRAAADLEIEVIATREYRAATVTKMKDGEDGKEFQFKLSEVTLGEDDDGFPITSCVVEHRENVARRASTGKVLTPAQQVVVRILDIAGDLAGGALHHAELKRMSVEQIPKDPTKKKDNRHRDVSTAIDSLIASGDLEVDDDGMVERAENRNE